MISTPRKTVARYFALCLAVAGMALLLAYTYAPAGHAQAANPVSGRVTDIQGNGIADVLLTISGFGGGQTQTTLTDPNGNYSFNNDIGGDTLTPSKPGYTFSPNSVHAVSSGGPVAITGTFNFVGGTTTYTLTGRVIDGTGAPLTGVLINVTGSLQFSVPVDENGNYVIEGLFAGGNYTLTPNRPGYAFNPAFIVFNNLSGNRLARLFVGTTKPYTITGNIKDENGNNFSGVTVTLTRASGTDTITTQTNSNGNYTFTNVASEATYTVTPSRAGYAFTPPSLSFTNPGANQTANFTGQPAPTLQFSAVNYNAAENSGSVAVTVSRVGDPSQAVSVQYRTTGQAYAPCSDVFGVAAQNCDYMTTSGTLSFAPGEVSKSFTVSLIDDDYVEGNEAITMGLSNPVNIALGSPNLASITVQDNDTSAATANKIDISSVFVRQHYLDFLSREPDQGGWDYWTSQLEDCTPKPQCLESRRVGVSAAFFIELEFQDTGSFVYRFYKATYGQRPLYSQFMPDRSKLVAGTNLETSKQAFAEEWVQRPEFLQKYPASLSGSDFIDALLLTVKQGSGVDLSSRKQSLLDDYNINHSRARIVRLVADDAAFQEAEYNRAFVLMQYFGYLRRDPDEGGYLFWLDVLNNKVPGNFRGMVCAFITSAEYQKRFSPVVTRNDQICSNLPQ